MREVKRETKQQAAAEKAGKPSAEEQLLQSVRRKLRAKAYSAASMQRTFAREDKDKSGGLDEGEFRHALTKLVPVRLAWQCMDMVARCSAWIVRG